MLKEIVTKAVLSKGKLVDSNEMQFEIKENVNKVIGCWVINHNYLSLVENAKVYASGCYDVHVWYSINNSTDTCLFKKTIDYKQEFGLENTNFDYDNCEYKMYCIDYPSCSNLELDNNLIKVTIKKGLAIDVIGESKLLVQVSDNYTKDESDLGININYINR